jgi:hypothetical protein
VLAVTPPLLTICSTRRDLTFPSDTVFTLDGDGQNSRWRS